MKQKHAVIVLLALVMASGLTSFSSYRATERLVEKDMNQALALALDEQKSDVISADTIKVFNSHLQLEQLRGKAMLAVNTRQKEFRCEAKCSMATIFSMSEQRPALALWMLAMLWAVFCFLWRLTQRDASFVLADTTEPSRCVFGGLRYNESESRFINAKGEHVRLTPMQQQLMEMFFRSPSHTLSKTEICDALWPKKEDANETLYTLIRRLKPIIKQHSNLKIEVDRGKAYGLREK